MKYKNIYSHLIFLLAFQQINCTVSAADSTEEQDEPPPPQDVPRFITAEERTNLLTFIKGNQHEKVVEFFRKNELLDFSMIRFQSQDEINGFTPLAAAIRYCAKETAKILAPIQFGFPWTVTLAPRHTLLEIAAKHCPSLLVEIIKSDKKNPLAHIVQDVDLNQITDIQLMVSDKNSKLTDEERKTLAEWIESLFQKDLEELFSSKDDKPIKTISDFKILLSNWINSGRDIKQLVEFLKEKVLTSSVPLYSHATVELIKADKTAEFTEVLKQLDSDAKAKTATIISASTHITPSQLTSLSDDIKAELRNHFTLLDVEDNLVYFQKFLDALTELILAIFLEKVEAEPVGLTMAEAAAARAIIKANKERNAKVMSALNRSINKFLPYAYKHFIQRYPRIDTVLKLFPLDHAAVQVVWVGDDKSIDSQAGFTGFSKQLIEAFKSDNADDVKNLLTSSKWTDKDPDQLRFHFPPYKLSLIKTAIMLNKPQILKYLMSRANASLYLGSKHQLTAIEMAGCYQPEFLVDQILPLISSSCKKRLRAANNLIAMFRETGNRKCPTGAQNASLILPKLVSSTKAEEVSCIDFGKKDAIEEAFKYNFPADLIKAFHATGKYTNIEFYIYLSARRGSIELFNYFDSKRNPAEPSKAVEEALATWVRFTNGIMNDENVKMLEFLLSHKGVKINALMEDSGVSALSFAVRRSLTWIVKRLVLEKDIDVNVTDVNTLATPIQHAIYIFRNALPADEFASQPCLVRTAIQTAKFFDFIMDAKQIGVFVTGSEKWFKEQKFERLDVIDLGLEDVIKADPTDSLKINELIVNLDGKTLYESIPIILRFLDKIMEEPAKVEAVVRHPLFAGFVEKNYGLNLNALDFEFIKYVINYVKDVLKQSLYKYGEYKSIDLQSETGRFSANSGLVHNVLLSHPSIDTTVENSAHIDTLYITKKRATYLVGDDDGVNEMSRTHIRVRNIDTLNDNKRNYKRIIYGAISTVFIGTVSAGIIRWML